MPPFLSFTYGAAQVAVIIAMWAIIAFGGGWLYVRGAVDTFADRMGWQGESQTRDEDEQASLHEVRVRRVAAFHGLWIALWLAGFWMSTVTLPPLVAPALIIIAGIAGAMAGYPMWQLWVCRTVLWEDAKLWPGRAAAIVAEVLLAAACGTALGLFVSAKGDELGWFTAYPDAATVTPIFLGAIAGTTVLWLLSLINKAVIDRLDKRIARKAKEAEVAAEQAELRAAAAVAAELKAASVNGGKPTTALTEAEIDEFAKKFGGTT